MSKPAVLKTVNANPSAPTDATVKGGQIQKTQPAKTLTKMATKEYNQNTQPKKISRKSSKPILTWFQRKLAGSSKSKRGDSIALGMQGGSRGRTVSATLPRTSNPKQSTKRDNSLGAHRATLSLTDDERGDYETSFDDDRGSVNQSVLTRESLWSPQSTLEADDDASVRPIPPSAPPSPSPSRSSSSVLSDPRTFRSMAASTKPTTVLSIELGNGMAHIAQVPPNATPNPVHRIAPHIRNASLGSTAQMSSGNSVTFSTLPASTSPQTPSVRNFGSISSMNHAPPGSYSHVQAPLHTSHHPRNNPRPSSPPLDNASMLTLASSAYAIPARGSTTRAYSITTSILGDNASYYNPSMALQDGESTSQFVDDDDRDIDASVRALRPRSSRRGSWESEVSRWSARVIPGGGTPSLARERSYWTTNSTRGGLLSADGFDPTKEDDDGSMEGKATSLAPSQFDELDPDDAKSLPENSDTKEVLAEDGKKGDEQAEPSQPEPQKQQRRPSVETIGSPAVKQPDAGTAPPVPSMKPSSPSEL
ncbi:hypothetical protein BKA70DRAFT_1258490 [Coprinopsis sp. MPI-PUGE-AT-0042]|nr:hypothetical protein BKA70DRAFT_1258490 [Coprinopsis sp. MPI-PUGE-AT-0042]